MKSKIFEPFSFKNGLQLKNRMMMAPMTISSSSPEGEATDEELTFYLMRSNGPGAVITGCAYISSEGQAFENGLSVAKDSYIKSLSKVSQVIQLQGAKSILQIYHGGRMANPAFNDGLEIIGPSSVKADRPWATIPTELSETGIQLLVKQFGNAVRRAIQAGFDGVELHGANTYLLQQFFSPLSNRRTDRYGGSLENRTLFIKQVIDHCQDVIDQYADKPFILGYRLSPEESENPGIRLEDTFYLIDTLVDHGVDYIHLSVSYHYQPSIVGLSDPYVQIPREIANHVNNRVPLISVGEIQTPKDAETTLEYADLASVARGFVVDPKWMQKVYDNEDKEIDYKVYPTDQFKLGIPTPLWNMMVYSHGWFPMSSGIKR